MEKGITKREHLRFIATAVLVAGMALLTLPFVVSAIFRGKDA